MDFRRVVRDCRYYALALQMALLLAISAYALYRCFQMLHSLDNPPVQTSMERWSNSGEWAICDLHPNPDQNRAALNLAGLGFFDNFTGMATFHPLHISPNTTKSAQEAWRLKQGVVDVDGTSRNCTLVDMTSVDFRKPASFTLCTELVGGC